jgi:RNA polymerase sigma factor (sigma-70 family)
MGENAGYLELIKQAQLGSEDSMSRLAEEARGKVFVYIYRVTLDYHLAQDLSQDTVLEMIKSLKRLKIENVNLFWSWLYRTALGKIQHHFRYQGNRRIEQKTIADGLELLNLVPQDRRSGLNALLRKELSQAILKTMGQLNAAYRNVLALRCFDQMSYAQIAAITGGTEMQARLLFFRAKHSLKKQLAQNGFKKEHLLPALGLFGAITASSTKPASAAIVVSSAAAKVGIATTIVGTVTSKSCIVAVATAVIVISTTTTAVKVSKNYAGFHTGSTEYAPYYGTFGTIRGRGFRPTSIIRSYPDGSGWKGANYLEQSGWSKAYLKRSGWLGDYNKRRQPGPTISISLEKLLVGSRQKGDENLFVILPANHWLELGFPGEIIDGPGIDICFDGRTIGEPPIIFITDGAGQEVQITSPPSYKNLTNGYRLTAYDISDLSLPPKPCALRFVGTDNKGPWKGAELWGVWTRVRE